MHVTTFRAADQLRRHVADVFHLAGRIAQDGIVDSLAQHAERAPLQILHEPVCVLLCLSAPPDMRPTAWHLQEHAPIQVLHRDTLDQIDGGIVRVESGREVEALST